MSHKYAYIDSYRLRANYPKFKKAQSEFDEEVRQWNLELEDEQSSIERLETEFAHQSLLYSDSEQRDRANAIVARKVALKNKAEGIFGPNGQAEKRNHELTQPLMEEINHALEVVAGQNGYDLVLDCVNGNIAFATKNLDVTDLVLRELEKAG